MSMEHEAALLLYREAMSTPMSRTGFDGRHGPLRGRYIKDLEEELERKKRKLEEFKRGSSLRVAVDHLMPGWVGLDASDHVAKEHWHSFIATGQHEWLVWLREHGVPEEKATELILEQWPEDDE